MSKGLFDEISQQKKRPVLLVLTGPTGAGKDTVIHKLLEAKPESRKIITTTTRTPRPGEQDGKHYHFVSKERFQQMVENGDLFEWVEFRDNLYGTALHSLEEALSKPHDILWRIDVAGVKNIKEKLLAMTSRVIFVYLAAPTREEMKQRVFNAEGENSPRWREDTVNWEVENFTVCEYVVENPLDNIDMAVRNILAIMQAKRLEVID